MVNKTKIVKITKQGTHKTILVYINNIKQYTQLARYCARLFYFNGAYTIINAKDNVKDTIIGTVASIISNSPAYAQGTVIIALAYNQDKIKVSARIAGRNGRNVRDVLHQVVIHLGGEVGGHPAAAGCMITRDKEEEFITELKKVLEIELVKV